MSGKLFSIIYRVEIAVRKMERIFHSIRTLTDTMGKGRRFCLGCGKIATREALFDVGGKLILIERYCSTCTVEID
jgi:hypothetical protein